MKNSHIIDTIERFVRKYNDENQIVTISTLIDILKLDVTIYVKILVKNGKICIRNGNLFAI